MIKFTVNIIPKAQMRARHGRTPAGFSRTYKAPAQRQEEDKLIALMEKHRPPEPLTGALALLIRAYLPIPASWSKKKIQEARAGLIRPTSKPDLDNLAKHVKDCLTSLSFWHDDKQVVEYLPGTGKYYDDGQGPRWELEIVERNDPGANHEFPPGPNLPSSR